MHFNKNVGVERENGENVDGERENGENVDGEWYKKFLNFSNIPLYCLTLTYTHTQKEHSKISYENNNSFLKNFISKF